MIKIDSLRLYTQVADGIIYTPNAAEPYILTYFSENSLLIDDYSKLNMRRMDVRLVVTPITKVPRTRLQPDTIKLFKQYGLMALSQKMRVPKGKSFLFDMSNYLNKIDLMYKPVNYRMRAGTLIKSSLNSMLADYPPNYKRVLLYSIDLTKDLKSFINRKFFPVLQMMKDGVLPFDHIVLVLIDESRSYHRLIVKNKKVNLNRIIPILKRISAVDVKEEINDDLEKASKDVVDKMVDKKLVRAGNKTKVKDAVVSYLKQNPKKLDKILSNDISHDDMVDVTTSSILQQASGNSAKANRIVDSIPKNKKETALKAVDKNFTDQIITPEKTITTSNNVAIRAMDVPNMVDDKSPEHLFKKRAIDFQINLKNDMYNSFKILENKEVPLKIESLNVIDKKTKAGELDKSDESVLKVRLKDEFGNIHDLKIELPKIDPTSGTFRINGQKKCLVNQIILCPITFPKPYDSKFESSYSSFHIWSKKTKKVNYLEIYIASYKLPYLILLAYSFGFENVLKQYGIKYKTIQKRPKKSEYGVKIDSENYIVFESVDTDLKKEIVNSFIRTKIDSYNVDKPFGTSEYFNDLIIKITGKINSTYKIRTNLENIVDPVARQVLMNQELPIELDNIMKYMSQKVVAGFTQARNDLTNQRIRNSEVLVHLAQKQILAAYTNFKEQVLAGNKSAQFQIVPTKVLSDFINSEIVVNMEYGNPLEELATLSKVSPVGKSIGGIPGKEAVQMEARNVHESYYGNIDPLDTPEGPNIGITQQLTVDSYITSARGLIRVKPHNDSESSGILSTSTAMIPFIENNEGARIIMAANQARQILPLKNPETPIVQSGYESILTSVVTDSFIKKAPCPGKIIEITTDHISVQCKSGKTDVDISPVALKSGSGKNTLSMFRPTVRVGQVVKHREIIAEGSCIEDGSIALGRTLAVGILPYKGFNFEDGVVINERLVDGGKLTSLHLIEENILISEKDRLLFINNLGEMTNRGEPLLRKTIGEIEELIGFEEDDTTDITAGQFIKKSPGGLIADIDVFSNTDPEKFPQLKDLINRTNKRYGKPSKEKFTIRGNTIEGVLVRFKIQQELKINLGDKMCNRYGNKGIVSLIEKDELMPRTPWGERLDFVINPLGILNRMNIGQLYEMYCGLISRKLSQLLIKNKNKNDFVTLVKKVIPLLDTSKNQEYSTKFINNLLKLNDAQFSLLWEQINNKKVFPIIIPPFKSPNFKMIGQALKSLDLKTKYKMYLPEFNCYTNYEVPFGYMYIYKLEHMGDMKIHSRSTGPVTGKVLQPTAGKAREGGQRLGEQESLSFVSYGALLTLQEFFGPLSDDHVTKNEIISDIIQTGKASYRIPKTNPSKDLLNAYFISLMISG